MKKLILLLALLLPFAATAKDFCNDLSGGARTVMKVRQSGLDAATQHSIVDQTTFGTDADLLHMLINDAYTHPVVSQAEKQDAIDRFSIYWLIKCMKARNGVY